MLSSRYLFRLPTLLHRPLRYLSIQVDKTRSTKHNEVDFCSFEAVGMRDTLPRESPVLNLSICHIIKRSHVLKL